MPSAQTQRVCLYTHKDPGPIQAASSLRQLSGLTCWNWIWSSQHLWTPVGSNNEGETNIPQSFCIGNGPRRATIIILFQRGFSGVCVQADSYKWSLGSFSQASQWSQWSQCAWLRTAGISKTQYCVMAAITKVKRNKMFLHIAFAPIQPC